MENKVVLHVMGMESSKYGGIERFNVALSKALLEKGIHSVFVYESEPANPRFIEDLKAVEAEIFVSNSRQRPFRFCRDFVRLLKKFHPILVHAHFTKARFYAIPIAYCYGVRKLFFTIHSRMDPKDEIKRPTRLWYSMANKIANVIGVSDDIASTYTDNWPKATVRRIYLGVDPICGDRGVSRARLGTAANQMVLLTIANFNHIKGLDVLCRSVKVLKDRGQWNDNVSLYIVGQPDADIEDLMILVETLHIENEVMMVGISNEIPDYLVSADLYLQTSRSEGLPLALMEAASASLPLIGTKVGGIPEIVKDGCNGLLVESENENKIADAIGMLMHDESLRRKYGEQSRKVYQEAFCVTTGVERTIDYYGI